MTNKFRIGNTVKYTGVCGTIHTKILGVKEGGNLILDTEQYLIKNVCVMPHRVELISSKEYYNYPDKTIIQPPSAQPPKGYKLKIVPCFADDVRPKYFEVYCNKQGYLWYRWKPKNINPWK